MDLRERVVQACAQGATVSEVAARFGVCTRTVSRYRQRSAQGELAPLRAPGKAPLLAKDQEWAFVALLQESHDWTLETLALEWERRSGVHLARSTVHDHLKRLGGRYKKRAARPTRGAR